MSKPVQVVICDDSRMARKQMASALRGWNVEVTFAEHGLEALEAIRAGKGDLLFLDLTMPIMDGYQVLERIRKDDLPTMVIVVSGDVQPEARQRVLELGALEFIQKPTSPEIIAEVLQRFGLLSEVDASGMNTEEEGLLLELPEYYQEVSNIAMGQAGERLARLLNTFVHLSIPLVTMLNAERVHAHFVELSQCGAELTSQGFIGGGIAGEALLLLPPGELDKIAALVPSSDSGTNHKSELLMSVSNALAGAFLASFSQQLDVMLSKATPVILRDYQGILESTDLFTETLTIRIKYYLNQYGFECELLLVFTPDSLPTLLKIASYF